MSLAEVFQHYGIDPPFFNKGKIKCPLDHERNPSCSVDMEKGLWTCFSCGEGGDDITLIMLREDIDVKAAFRRREEITGRSDRPIRAEPQYISPISGKPGRKPGYSRAIPARARRHFQ